MKSKNLKRILILTLAIILCVSMVMSTVMIAFGDEKEVLTNNKPILSQNGDTQEVDGEVVFEIWKEFQESHPNRTGGTEHEVAAGDYLATKFEEIGLSMMGDSYVNKFSKYIDKGDGKGSLTYSQNIIGVQKSNNSNGKHIIIGAHYDNTYSMQYGAQSQGASDNGSGVAVVLALAEVLKNYEFDFDIVFVFFGMEEQGLYGSADLLSKMGTTDLNNPFSGMNKEDTLLMINLDSIVSGDNLYAFSDELPRHHEDIFFKHCEQLGTNVLTKTPNDKKAVLNYFNEKYFYHFGLSSDNVTFMNEGINTISLQGYNLDAKSNVGGAEQDGESNIVHTKDDNINEIINRYGMEHIHGRFENVVNLIINTLTDTEFVSAMAYSKENPTVMTFFYSKYFLIGVTVATFVIFFLALYLLNKKVSKEIPEKVEEKAKPNITEQDIFNLFETIKKQQQTQENKKNDDDDDIFG